ncbi:hypothetical protein FPCIR_11384 [Fusarium pseudocircinatum]|uniref:Uncharacterized protein n=1 Tax=Fusarium pseudocircinatum TaxID=56676 RepID=A0A8H5KSX2_9HYPO|nr:hypothetical protein FPCIR_11384 [Fusarium pseudocircinatum]
MHYSILLATLQVAGFVQAIPALPGRDIILTMPDNRDTPPAIDTLNMAKRQPTEPLVITKIQSDEHELNASNLQKRTLNIKVRFDTGTAYRATYNGLAVVIHIFYDLAVNNAVFNWTLDGTNAAPGQLTFGFKDLNTNAKVSAKAYAHDTRYTLGGGFKGNDIINIFQH